VFESAGTFAFIGAFAFPTQFFTFFASVHFIGIPFRGNLIYELIILAQMRIFRQ